MYKKDNIGKNKKIVIEFLPPKNPVRVSEDDIVTELAKLIYFLFEE